jgi:hypothetical protein
MDPDRIAAGLGPGPITFVEHRSSAPVPARWREIVDADTPAARCALALSMWNKDFTELVPEFFASLEQHLADVRVCDLRGSWVLVYVTRDPELVWVGWDPASFGDTVPPFWAEFPEPLRVFLTGVHAGLTDQDFESFGPLPPQDMLTYAQWAGYDGPIAEWDIGERISSTRLTVIAKDSGLLLYTVSSDAPGKMVLLYEGDIDTRQDFGPALDEWMARRFDPEWQ